MNPFPNWPDFSESLESLNQREKQLQEYYSKPFIDTSAIQQGYAPQTLAPHGANARVITPAVDMATPTFDVSANPNDTIAKWDATFKSKEYNTELNEAAKANAMPTDKGFSLDSKAVSGGLNFVSQAFNSTQGVDGSESESWAKTGQLAMSGASLGMQVGGPWGAAIGAVTGGTIGLINKGSDRRKRDTMTRDKNAQIAADSVNRRKRDYEIKEAEREIELLTSHSKSQLNYLK